MSPIENQEARPEGWKQKAVSEFIEYWINFAFLAFFLVAFAWYRRLVLASYHIHDFGWWGPLIEAAILAKLIMVGDVLRMGREMKNRPLVVVTVYRTAVFGVFVGLFTICEHVISGLIHHKPVASSIAEIANRGIYEVLARTLLVIVAFLPFFAFKELERVFGAARLRALFLRGPTPSDLAKATE